MLYYCCFNLKHIYFVCCFRTRPTHPGPIVHLSDNPADSSKVNPNTLHTHTYLYKYPYLIHVYMCIYIYIVFVYLRLILMHVR